MEREGDRDLCRPLLIPANPGFAIPVNANSASPSDSVKFEGDLRGIVSRFHPAIVTTVGDFPATVDLYRLVILRQLVVKLSTNRTAAQTR
jgi:hypothetical protein